MGGNLQDKQSIETYYVQAEGADSVAIRFIEIAISKLPSDYEKLRVLNYHVQKIMDARNAEMEQMSKLNPPMQEAPHGPAR